MVHHNTVNKHSHNAMSIYHSVYFTSVDVCHIYNISIPLLFSKQKFNLRLLCQNGYGNNT